MNTSKMFLHKQLARKWRSAWVSGLSATTLMLSASVAFSSEVVSVESAPVISAKPKSAVFWRSVPDAVEATVLVFAPLTESAFKDLQEENSKGLKIKPLSVGINRSADTEIDDGKSAVAHWQNVGDGNVARWAVTSPEAKSLRVALQLNALPDNAELRFAGSDAPEKIVSVISGAKAKALRSEGDVYWTPITEGEIQNIEIYLPSIINTEDIKVEVSAVSHLFVSIREGFNKKELITKEAGACHVDVVCKDDDLGAGFQNASRAVGMMYFTDNLGTRYCSSTLLNDAAYSQTPYLWSAAHCFSTQSLANTVYMAWYNEAAQCGSSQRSSDYYMEPEPGEDGGAELLHAGISTDTLLLRLRVSPPNGVWFSGWDASRFSSGDVIGIHHPSWDYKKVSTGVGDGRTCDAVFRQDPQGADYSTLSLINWSEGSTEPGSSGSGLFTRSSEGAYYLRGGLMGGAASCENEGGAVSSGNADCYSSLTLVWDDIKQWLSASEPVPSLAPVLSDQSVTNITATGAAFGVTSDRAAVAYWIVLPADDPAPTANEIVAGAGSNTGAMVADVPFHGALTDLSQNTAYKLYFVAGSNDVYSVVWSESFRTEAIIDDVPAPVLSLLRITGFTGSSVSFRVTSNRDATAYWTTTPVNVPFLSAAQIIERAGSHTGAMNADEAFRRTVSGLRSYRLYWLHFAADNGGGRKVRTALFFTFPRFW